MDNLVPGSVQRLLLNYNFEIDPDYSKNSFICTSCGKLMIDVYKTYCGCKYCHQCIVMYLNGMDEYCMGGKEECKEEPLVLEHNVCRNPAITTKITKLRVVCPYESCTLIKRLCQMEDHMEVCAQRPILCPYVEIGCDSERVSKDKIESHLHNDSFSHSQLLVHFIKEQFDEVKKRLKKVSKDKIRCKEDKKNYTINKNKESNEVRLSIERFEAESDERGKRERSFDKHSKNEVEILKRNMMIDRRASKKMKDDLDSMKREIEALKETLKTDDVRKCGERTHLGEEFSNIKDMTNSLIKDVEIQRDMLRIMKDDFVKCNDGIFTMMDDLMRVKNSVTALQKDTPCRNDSNIEIDASDRQSNNKKRWWKKIMAKAKRKVEKGKAAKAEKQRHKIRMRGIADFYDSHFFDVEFNESNEFNEPSEGFRCGASRPATPYSFPTDDRYGSSPSNLDPVDRPSSSG